MLKEASIELSDFLDYLKELITNKADFNFLDIMVNLNAETSQSYLS